MSGRRHGLSMLERAAADKNSEWIAQSHQLQARSKAAHKNAALALLAMRGEMQADVIDVEDQQRKMAAVRKDEAAVLFAQLNQVKQNVASLRDMIESRGTGQEYVDSLRAQMDCVENEIFTVRQGHHSKFETLSTEEKQLADAVAAVEAEILEWLTGDEAVKGRPATAGARPGTSGDRGATEAQSKVAAMINMPQLPPEVVAVERLLKEAGGSTGGWDDADHERFLRYRTQFKAQPHIYCARTAEDLADHDLASVEQHEMWYVHYLKLLEEKKAAIRAWRSNKHSSALLENAQGGREGSPLASARGRSRPSTASALEPRPDSALTREAQKEQLRKWREEKEAAEAEEKKKKEEEEALRVQREKEKLEKAREEARRRISNYKNSKEAEEERKKQDEQDRLLLQREKAKVPVEQLERIRLRNMQMAQEHINLVRRKAEEQRAQAERLETLIKEAPAPEVDRDPSRVTALTEAQRAKRDARLKKDGEEPERPGYFAIMRPSITPHTSRAVPSWRSGV